MSQQFIASHYVWERTDVDNHAERRLRTRTVPGYMTINEVMAWIREQDKTGGATLSVDESQKEVE